ncbi:class I SAM-dependent methyltransferase [candidate division KSB1 bacterium]
MGNKYYRLLKLIDKNFKFRHEIYNARLEGLLTPGTVWLDIGCGDNSIIGQFGNRCRSAAGFDISRSSKLSGKNFIRADLTRIPFKGESVDLVTLRMVVEHLKDIPEDLLEVERILKKGGTVLLMTTNILSPLVFIGRLFPDNLKRWLIGLLFKIDREVIFPAYHRFNSFSRLKKGAGRLRIKDLEFIEQASPQNSLLFFTFLIPFLLTRIRLLRYFRSNIIALFEKV